MNSLKASQTQKATQTSEPPAWAKPLLQKAASSAQGLFDSGSGYNPYRGPTVADFSPQKLQALNSIMKMTGGGPEVTNAAMTGGQNPQVAQAQALIQQQIQQQQAQRAAAAAAAAAAAKPAPKQQQPSTPYPAYAWNTRTGTPFSNK